MKQKQRGSDRHTTRVKVTLKTKEIEIKGRKLELEPYVEKMALRIESIPKDVSEAMGIHLIVPEIELLLFDNKGFKDYISEIDGEEYKGHYVAFYYPGRTDIPVNVEGSAASWSKSIDGDSPETKELIVDIAIMSISWHEVAHMAHDLYDKKAFEKKVKLLGEFWEGREGKIDRVSELANKDKLNLKESYDAYRIGIPYAINYRRYLGFLKHLALEEGIARWTEREVIRMNVSKEAAEAVYGIPKPMKLSEKIDLSHDDEYDFGYRFFEKISQMTDANVIKLAIQHNPTYIEMLYPELYILRMKAALLI